MSKQTIKVVIPMAGLGTRLRPHTWSRPKQLMSVAGRTVLDHVLDMLKTLPQGQTYELINIIGYLGEQIEAYVHQYYPEVKAHFVVQENPRGQSHAIHLARQYIEGPMLMVFADTLIETDLSFLANEPADGVAWVKPVPDPRRFGVAKVGSDGWVSQLIEKPQDMSNNLAVVGCYYFKRSEDLLAAIDEQMHRGVQLKGEYYLADAINIMLEQGMRMRAEMVGTWLDAGTPEAVLDTNRYLLEHGHANQPQDDSGVVIIPPVFIHPSAKIKQSVVGPHVSIGPDCQVEHVVVRDSILEEGAQVKNLVIEQSLIGRHTQIQGRPRIINAGDSTGLSL